MQLRYLKSLKMKVSSADHDKFDDSLHSFSNNGFEI